MIIDIVDTVDWWPMTMMIIDDIIDDIDDHDIRWHWY